ncbi:MAG: M14 family zinc carboxypeptidase [Candidatus Hermodarchaeota archaeon]
MRKLSSGIFLLVLFLSSICISVVSGSFVYQKKEFSVVTSIEDNPEGVRYIPDGTMGDYHTYEEAIAEINQIVANYPTITHKEIIGQSVEGRDLVVLKISDNPEVDEEEPEVFYMAQLHAREAISAEIALGIINYLVENYGTDSEVTEIVDTRELWILPVANPDGSMYVANTDGSWRKNRRDNGDGTYGVDLNRNWGYKWGQELGSSGDTSAETYRGISPFSEPETQAIRDFILDRDFVASISYHSYGNLILYPWSYTNSPCSEKGLFNQIAIQAAGRQSYESYIVQQSAELYPASGESEDWLYGELGILAFTFEIYEGGSGDTFDTFNPPEDEIPYHVTNNIPAALYLASIADNPSQVLDFQSTIVSPTDGEIITETPTRIIVNATKKAGINDRPITKAETKIDSGIWIDITLNVLGTNSWYYDWIVTLTSEGKHVISARVTNDLNQTAYAPNIAVSVFDSPPKISEIILSPFPVTTKTNLSVTFHAQDDRGLVSSLSKVYYKDFAQFFEVKASLLNGTVKNGWWRAFIPLNLDDSASGRILEIKPSVTDTGGNIASGPSEYARLITPDQPYVDKLTYYPKNVTTETPISVEFKVIDDSEIATAAILYKDVARWYSVTANQTNGTLTESWWYAVIPALPTSGGRTLEIKATATDVDGNVGESESIYVAVFAGSITTPGFGLILVITVCLLIGGVKVRKSKK